MPEKIIKDFIENVGPYAGLGAFGGVALYLNKVRNGTPFRIGAFIINILLSAWIGVIVFSVLPADMGTMKIGLISVSGFLSYPILTFLEENGLDLFLNKFGLGKEKKK